MKQKLMIGAAVAALCAAQATAGIVATFDWAEASGNWWDGASYAYTETENGVTLVSGGRSTSSTADGGTALKAAYAQDLAVGTFEMKVGGDFQDFSVLSLDIGANDSNGEFVPAVQGFLDGAAIWSITPTLGASIPYTSATVGNLTDMIDQIVWTTGESTTPGAAFGNTIDNLSVDAIPEPATLGLIGIFGGAMVFIRRHLKV